MNPLERASWAIHDIMEGEHHEDNYMRAARAALTAIRYAPDDDFFARAGEELPPEFQSRGDKGVIASSIWQAMIDAALAE